MKIPEVLVVRSRHKAGSLAATLQVLGDAGVVVEGLRATQRDYQWTTWEITVEPPESFDLDAVVTAIDALDNAQVVGRSDRVFDRHRGGKLDMVSRRRIDSDEILRDLYTPGVARVCLAIQSEPARAYDLTGVGRTVAIVTNGTAVLGLGNIGAAPSMPVMEGKAALMSELAGLSGIPILIDSEDPEVVVEAVERIAGSFGAIQLEDIRAPECFAIEDALRERLAIPVMHDDQHGTAVVALAALLAALDDLDVDLHRVTVGQIGLGAAGIGIGRLLARHGVGRLLGADRDEGARARYRQLGGETVDLDGVMAGADVVISTTGVRGLIAPDKVRKGQIILALSNPTPEIEPEDALAHGAAFATDGKSVNNVLGFPGIFRGALDARARRVTDDMLIAAARTLQRLRAPGSLLPPPLDPAIHTAVADAVAAAVRPER